MASQFFGLNIAYSGLLASNASLNTTGNNIANAQTKGYSRQQVNQQAARALRTKTSYGSQGAGVEAKSIDRMRDVFYDFKYWDNNANVGEQDVLQYYMKQLEDLFKDDPTAGVIGFSHIFDELINKNLDSLIANAGDATNKEQFVSTAQKLAYYFNTAATDLENMQEELNSQIKIKIDQINTLSTSIAHLNHQINVLELSGASANELRDQRDLLIDELSLIVDVEVIETPMIDPNYPNVQTGATRCMIKIAGGQTLIDGKRAHSLSCQPTEDYEKKNQSDIVGLYNVYFDDGRSFNLNNSLMGGELAGLVQMRDGNNGENFNGTIGEVISGNPADPDDKTTVKIDVAADFLKNFNSCNIPEQGVIRLGSEYYYYDSFSFQLNADGEVESYTFEISGDDKNHKQPSAADRIGKEAVIGNSVNYQGIPYYQQQLTEWARAYSEAFNKILTQDGELDNLILFQADKETASGQYEFGAMGNSNIDCKDDSYYRMTAKNFSISAAIVYDPTKLAGHTGNESEESKYDIFGELKDMATNPKMMSFRGGNASDFLKCILTDLALNGANAYSYYEKYTDMQYSIETKRLSISGVDEDEEALNLTKYQHSYNLACQMIKVLTEMYDRLILQTGV